MSEVKCTVCGHPLIADDHIKGCPTIRSGKNKVSPIVGGDLIPDPRKGN